MKLLTVGIPVYNAMPYLPECIRSVREQAGEDVDILIIDDGSSDESATYLRTLKGPNLRVIHQENHGLTYTLNRMLRESATPWLVRQDADDIAFPGRLNEIRAAIAVHPDAGMLYSAASYWNDGRVIGSFRSTIAAPEVLRALTFSGYLLGICHPTVALNIEKTTQLGGYRFNYYVEDIDLWWRMAINYDIRFIPTSTIGFRLNSNSSSSANLERQWVNTSFIQYLLLSHLWGYAPKSYDDVLPTLKQMVNYKHLLCRDHLRRCSMAIANRRYFRGAWLALRAALSSPSIFAHRLMYEFAKDSSAVVNGIDPREFAIRANQLWSSEVDRDSRLQADSRESPSLADCDIASGEHTSQVSP